jgi:hypothetical protein
MISAMAHGGRILGEQRYLQAARRALGFLLERMRLPGGKLARSSKGGKIGASAGFLDDYAFVAAAALDLYEATFEVRWLEAALALSEDMERLFGDKEHGGWYASSHIACLSHCYFLYYRICCILANLGRRTTGTRPRGSMRPSSQGKSRATMAQSRRAVAWRSSRWCASLQ